MLAGVVWASEEAWVWPVGLGCRLASLPPCFKSTGEGWTHPASQGLLLTPSQGRATCF